MSDIRAVAKPILGGVLITLLTSIASYKGRSVIEKLGRSLFSSLTSGYAPSRHGDAISTGGPLTREQVTSLFPEGTWQRRAYDDYKAILLDEEVVFPCIYATKGFKTDDQLYLFIDSDDISDPRHVQSLAVALSAYLPQAHGLGANTSLVLLAKQVPTERTVEEYNALFWKMLDGLAKLDTAPWPSYVPRETDTDKWCLCFGGEMFFTVIQTPAHQVRRSRYAKGLTIVFQPKWIFDILFSTDAKRVGALSKVRALLAKYDPIPVSPELKNYGEAGSRECHQYFLLDENVPAKCPYERLSTPGSVKA